MSRYLFSWIALVPYLAFYLAWAALGLPVERLTLVFRLGHCLWIGLALLCLFRSLRSGGLRARFQAISTPDLGLDLGMGLILAAIVFLPGAYLEFPSDAWEHFRRIFAWQDLHTIRENGVWTKFSYFWLWTFATDLPMALRRLFLDGVSGLVQWILFFQFFRIARRFGFSSLWSWVQVFGVICLLGNNVFSFRYYALSSTGFSYTAFLSGVVHLLDLRNRAGKGLLWQAWRWPLLALFLAFNHVQELLLLGVAFGAFGVTRLWRPDSPHVRWRRPLLIGVAAIWIGSLALSYGLLGSSGGKALIFHLVKGQRVYDPFAGWLSRFGVFRFWDIRGHYFEALGVWGCLGALSSALLLRRRSEISVWVLMPVFLMVFPPWVLPLVAFTEVPNTYRILYAFPASFGLVEGLRLLALKVRTDKRIQAALVAGVLALAGAFPKSPWRGRLWFQLHRVDPILELRPFDASVEEWRRRNYGIVGIPFVADTMTQFLFTTQFGLALDQVRTYPGSRFQDESWVGGWENLHLTCTLFYPLWDQAPALADSPVARYSGHWTASAQNMILQKDKDPQALMTNLKRIGYVERPLPPYHRVFLNPRCFPGLKP